MIKLGVRVLLVFSLYFVSAPWVYRSIVDWYHVFGLTDGADFGAFFALTILFILAFVAAAVWGTEQ